MSCDEINRDLERGAPNLFRALSPLGRQAFFPRDIPFQAAEARGTTYNGTIGVFTDGAGNAVPLPSMADAFTFSGDQRNRAFLYSPVLGMPELRRQWREWQRGDQAEIKPTDAQPSTVPAVTVGLTHGLSMCADLFGDVGRTLVVAEPYWGNYRQIFGMRRGVEVRSAPAYRDGVYDPTAIPRLIEQLPEEQPAIALVNFPSNPGGYSPTASERQILRDGLVAAANKRPLVVLCDDAYGGLAFADGIPNDSLFWQLSGAHERLIPVKIDGATKEFAYFGGRVGFLTFGVDLDEASSAALDSKLSSLIRSTVGSPVASSQMVLLESLSSGSALAEVEAVRQIARQRYEAVMPALAELDPKLLRPLPFNAGFFVLMELAPGIELDPHVIRRHLIEHYDTGIVSAAPNYLRLALCSVAAEALPEMVRRVEAAVRELASASH